MKVKWYRWRKSTLNIWSRSGISAENIIAIQMCFCSKHCIIWCYSSSSDRKKNCIAWLNWKLSKAFNQCCLQYSFQEKPKITKTCVYFYLSIKLNIRSTKSATPRFFFHFQVFFIEYIVQVSTILTLILEWCAIAFMVKRKFEMENKVPLKTMATTQCSMACARNVWYLHAFARFGALTLKICQI